MQTSDRFMAIIKLVLALAIFLVWGPYLLYVWWLPAAVPSWTRLPGFRRVLMLDIHYEPTIFTLLFGLGFSGLALYGLFAMLTGKARFSR